MRYCAAPAVLLAGVLLVRGEQPLPRAAPTYAGSSVVNAASNESGSFAPNTIATIFGANLSPVTRALSVTDLQGSFLPTALPGTGVRVVVGGIPAPIYFVSPQQINFLIPADLRPGRVPLYVFDNGRTGPVVFLELTASAPALFIHRDGWAVAARPDGSVITPDTPARPGEVVILYANGLGVTTPAQRSGQVAMGAAPLAEKQFSVLLNGDSVEPGAILYAGVAPGFAGLYQINLRLPVRLSQDPTLVIKHSDRLSPANVRLAVRE